MNEFDENKYYPADNTASSDAEKTEDSIPEGNISETPREETTQNVFTEAPDNGSLRNSTFSSAAPETNTYSQPQQQQQPQQNNVYTNTPPYNPPQQNAQANQQSYPYGKYPYNASQPQNRNPYSQPQNGYPYRNSTPQQNSGYAYGGPQMNGSKPAKSKGTGKKVFIGVLICVALIIVGSVAFIIGKGSTPTAATEEKPTASGNEAIDNVDEFTSSVTPEKSTNTSSRGALEPYEIYTKMQGSSVGILVYAKNSKSLSSEGTGIIFTEDHDGKYTYIVTCAHVISDKGVNIIVQLYDQKEYQAQVVGYDTKTDIGVLRIEASGLTIAEFGDSSKLKVGDWVYAIGNPGGTEFANSFTNGMISAIDRPVSSSETGYTTECIQHTAAINPGNSGGALVNEFGQVIGINSMKIVDDEYEGMGFAVPSSVFIKIVNEIIANGYVTNRPKLGITYIAASNEQAYAMFVAIKGLPSGSIIIYSISDDSALANTEAKKGDMIVAVNGKQLDESSYLSELVENSKVGDTITLSLVRINDDYTYDEFDVEVKLVEDRGDTYLNEEETTTSIFNDYFGDGYNGNDGYDYYDFGDFFGDFFGNYGR